MSLELSFAEVRVLGSLIEKDLAAPDYYPLTLNALVNACNQKTSRDPVTSLTEAEVNDALESLVADSVVRERNPAGSRTAKYAHALGDTLGLRFGFDRDQLAVLAVLLLRGPQTPGELRSRGARMRGTEEGRDVEDILDALAGHERGPWVARLEREAGRREARWQHLLGDGPVEEVASASDATVVVPPAQPAPAAGVDSVPAGQNDDDRVQYLEEVVLTLEQRLDELEARLKILEP